MNTFGYNAILRIASVSLFFLIWQFSSYFLDVELLPSPRNVIIKILEEASNNELFFHTIITLKRVFISFTIAMFIGTFFGIYMGRNKTANVFIQIKRLIIKIFHH